MVAVSKQQPAEKIRTLHQEGQIIFAENYVQEALGKQHELKNLPIEWHFIGHLQKNKAKDVVRQFDLIHSVDSVALAEALDRRFESAPPPANLSHPQPPRQNILLQLNLAGEITKGGFSEKELEQELPRLLHFNHLQITGLMTMPPLFENPEHARPYFKRLRDLRDQLRRLHPTIQELSMGTSSDYHIAADEGATLVRLGTILFGERPAKIS